MAAAPPTNASNAELVRWTFEQLNTHDVSDLRALWTQDTVERFPDGECRGPDQITAYFDGVFAALPDFHMEVRGIVEQGDDVYVQWHLTGTHTGGGFQGLDPPARASRSTAWTTSCSATGRWCRTSSSSTRCSSRARSGCCRPKARRPTGRVKVAFNAKTKIADAIAQQRESRPRSPRRGRGHDVGDARHQPLGGP